jgi:hypothetical protein
MYLLSPSVDHCLSVRSAGPVEWMPVEGKRAYPNRQSGPPTGVLRYIEIGS